MNTQDFDISYSSKIRERNIFLHHCPLSSFCLCVSSVSREKDKDVKVGKRQSYFNLDFTQTQVKAFVGFLVAVGLICYKVVTFC